MAAKVDVQKRGNVTVLVPHGKITIGAGDIALRNAMQETMSNGATNIVVNLGQVSTIDSSGVGELVSAYTTAMNRGAKVKLANLSPKINDILSITQLITVFDIYDSEDEAVASFSS